jgi:hypothetical protein
MIPLTGSTFLVWHRLKTSKYAIIDDKPLQKFDVQGFWSAKYTYLPEDRTLEFINQNLLLIKLGLRL